MEGENRSRRRALLPADKITVPVTARPTWDRTFTEISLSEPIPVDRDFFGMRTPSHMVRTGSDGWRNFMLDVGAPDESAFPRTDAFCSRPEDRIPIVFTLFAFLPKHGAGECIPRPPFTECHNRNS